MAKYPKSFYSHFNCFISLECFEADTNYKQNNLFYEIDDSARACQVRCQREIRCHAFTYGTRSRRCYLKTEIGEKEHFPGVISGPKFCPGSSKIVDNVKIM